MKQQIAACSTDPESLSPGMHHILQSRSRSACYCDFMNPVTSKAEGTMALITLSLETATALARVARIHLLSTALTFGITGLHGSSLV